MVAAGEPWDCLSAFIFSAVFLATSLAVGVSAGASGFSAGAGVCGFSSAGFGASVCLDGVLVCWFDSAGFLVSALLPLSAGALPSACSFSAVDSSDFDSLSAGRLL